MSHAPAPQRYETMRYAACGRSGLQLPKLALGFWHSFDRVTDFPQSRDLVLQAFDLGINHFDLANMYGPPKGEAERRVGEILRQDLGSYRDELIIATKAGYPMWDGPTGANGSRKHLLASLDQSLQRLGLDYVDIFYSHRADPDTPLEETMDALASAVRQGKALYVGVSSYSADRTRRASRILRELGVPCSIHQPNYNMLNRWIEDGLLEVLDEVGAGCIAFSPLAQGLLTTKYLRGVPENARVNKGTTFRSGFLNDENIDKVRHLNAIAEGRGQTLAQLAIAWVLRDPRVTSALIGASRPQQLVENVSALSATPLTAEELQEIDRYATPGDINIWAASTEVA